MSNKERVGNSFARHYSQYEQAAIVQRDMAARLHAAIVNHTQGCIIHRALEIGIGTGFLTKLLTASFPSADWWFNDLTPAAFDWIPAGLQQATTMPGDAEALSYPAQLDLLASASALQWFDNLPAFFSKSWQVLNPGGILAIATFGPQNLHELASLSGSILNYPTLNSLQKMVHSADFQILHIEEWIQKLDFPDAKAILEHLRNTGVNGKATGRIRTPAQLRAFEQAYTTTYAQASGTLPLTYHPLLLLASKPR